MSSKALNLQILPSEVIQKIIGVGQESLDAMRFISPRWNLWAIDHFKHRKRLPVIKRFTVFKERNNSSGVFMRFGGQYDRYFRVRHWAKGSIPEIYSNNDIGVRAILKKKNKINRRKTLAQIFSRCSLIKRVEMNNNNHFDHIDVLTDVMGDVRIEELGLYQLATINQELITAILEFARVRSVRQLEIGYAGSNWEEIKEDMITFFAHAVSFASTIVFIHERNNNQSGAALRAYWETQLDDLRISADFSAIVEVEYWPSGKRARLVIERKN